MRSISLLCLSLAGIAVAIGGHAITTAAPTVTTPVRIIVPLPAGGTSDLVARVVADSLREALGQTVIVENKPGATGRIAADALRNAKADGTTLLLTPIALPVLAPLLYRDTRFEVGKDTTPIGQVATYSFALAVRSDHPARNVAELVAWMRAHPTQATFGSPSTGSMPHLLGFMLGQASGVPLQHIPYRAAGQIETAILSGDIAAGISADSDFVEMHRAGKLRIIATSGAGRVPQLPTVPTFREQGFAGVEAVGWTALFAPAGTPKDVIDKLSSSVAASLRAREVREKLIAIGVEPTGSTPDELATIVARDLARWAPIVKAAGFVAE